MGTIVIAEDNSDLRELISLHLRDEGHDVTVTCDGVAALVAVRRQRPDVVVLDMQMPGLSGLDVVRMLRADATTADVPVLMVTSHDQPNYIGESFLSGVDDFLPKPFCGPDLINRVAQLLEHGRHSPSRRGETTSREPAMGRRGFLSLGGGL